jgi:hypothetical protein
MTARTLVPLLALTLFCACGEAEPWRGTVEGFLDAVEEGDLDGAARFCSGDVEELSPYLEPGVRPEVVSEAVDGGRVELLIRAPGRPGLTLVLAESDGAWLVAAAQSVEASRAAALNAAFGGE